MLRKIWLITLWLADLPATAAAAAAPARDPALAGQLSEGVEPMLGEKAQALGFYKWVVATPQLKFDTTSKGVQAILAAFASHRSAWRGVPG